MLGITAAALLIIGALGADHHGATTVDDLAFLTGSWKGDAFGGVADEVWLPPYGDNMTCAFRLFRADGSMMVQEIVSIDQGDDGPEFYLRHFSSGLTVWEAEKNGPIHLPVCELEGQSVTFSLPEGETGPVTMLRYVREGDTLTATVATGDSGSFDVVYKRVE